MNLLGRNSITIFMIIAAIIITFGTTLLIKSDLVFAISSAYQSGYNHGVDDASHPGQHQYISQPGKGFQFHTKEFNYGYIAGFCSIVGPGTSSDLDEATFDCAQGPGSASWVTR